MHLGAYRACEGEGPDYNGSTIMRVLYRTVLPLAWALDILCYACRPHVCCSCHLRCSMTQPTTGMSSRVVL